MALLALNITSSISTVPPSAYTAPPLTAELDANVEPSNFISPPETDNAPPFPVAELEANVTLERFVSPPVT